MQESEKNAFPLVFLTQDSRAVEGRVPTATAVECIFTETYDESLLLKEHYEVLMQPRLDDSNAIKAVAKAKT